MRGRRHNAVLVRCDAGRRFGVVAVDIDGRTIPNFLDLGHAGGLACLTVLDLARSIGDVAMSIMFSPTPLQNSFCA